MTADPKRSGSVSNSNNPSRRYSTDDDSVNSRVQSFTTANALRHFDAVGASSRKESKLGSSIPGSVVLQGDIFITCDIEAETEVLCIKYLPKRDMLAAGLTNGKIYLFNMATGDRVGMLWSDEDRMPVTCIKYRQLQKSFNAVSRVAATYVEGGVKFWEIKTGVCLSTIKEDRQTLGLAFHPNASQFVTVGDDGKVYLYDEESQTLDRTFSSSDVPDEMDGHMSRIFAASFNPTSGYEFVTGGWDDTMHFWDTREEYSIRHVSGIHMCGDGIDIRSGGREILTCSWQRQDPLQIWDYGTGKLIQSVQPDDKDCMLYCGKFASADHFLTGGSEVNMVRLVDFTTLTTVASVYGVDSGVYSVDSGMSRSRRSRHKQTDSSDNLFQYPKVSFSTGNKVYEFQFK